MKKRIIYAAGKYSMYDERKFYFDNKYFDSVKLLGNIRLVQVGDKFCQPDTEVTLHKNVCFELTYVYYGQAVVANDGNHFKVPAGNMVLTLPGQMHHIKAVSGEDLRFFFLGFELLPGHFLYDEYQLFLKMNYKNTMVRDYYNLSDNFIRILTELINITKHTEHIVETNIDYIITYYFKLLSPSEEKYDNRIKSVSEIVLYSIINYLDANFFTFSGNAELEKNLGYSISHISHTFSRMMNMTINQYVIKRKLNYAKTALITDKSITEIAELLGYGSIHSFSKAFKNAFGISPSGYQKLALEERRRTES